MKLRFKISLLILLASPVGAYEIRVTDGKVETSKYSFQGRPLFTDAERDAVLSWQVDSGTGTQAIQNDSVPALDQVAINELNNEGNMTSRSQALAEIQSRVTKAYLITRLMEFRQQITTLLQLNNQYGYDVAATTTAIGIRMGLMKARYDAATK